MEDIKRIGLLFVIMLIGFNILAYYKLFKTQKVNGIISVIPVYNQYMWFKIMGLEKLSYINILSMFVLIFIFIKGIAFYLAIPFILGYLYTHVQICMKITEYYRKNRTFMILLIVFPYIFIPVIAISDRSQYSFLSNYNFELLKMDIESYGFKYSFKHFLMEISAVLLLSAFIAYISKLQLFYLIILASVAVLILPLIIRAQFKRAYELKRFQMITSYIDNVVPVFKNKPITTYAWNDCLDLLEGNMKTVVKNALDYVLSDTTDVDPLKTAMNMIEKEFPNSRLNAIHRMMLTIEKENSLDYYDSVDNTYYDAQGWISRTYEFQKELKEKRNKLLLLCVMTMFFNCFFVYVYSSNNIFSSFTSMPLYQASTTFFLLALFSLASLFYIKLNGQWLVDDKTSHNQTKYTKAFDTVQKGNKKITQADAIMIVFVSVVVGFMYFVTKNYLYLVLGVGTVGYVLVNSLLSYNGSKKSVQHALEIEFPMWLRDVALNLQNLTVINAITNSKKSASRIMNYYIDLFLEDVYKNPTSIKPYNQFLSDYDVPDAKTAMKMLYTMQSLDDEQLKNQTNSLIVRNQSMLAKAERLMLEDEISGMNKYGFLPILLFMVQLFVSMAIMLTFLMNYLSGSMTF